MGKGSKGGFFRFADGTDKLLLLFGSLGCFGDGLQTPITMLVLGSLINDYADQDSQHSVSNHTIDKYALRLLYVAIGVAFCSFTEGVCWARSAERQTSQMRTEYLKSVLRQEVGFFDNQSSSSSTFKVIDTISSDAQTIQGALAEKVPNCLMHLSAFFSSYIVALILSWRLALAAFPFSIMMIMPAIIFGKAMKELGSKMKDAYEVAGGIAEQAISSIRTVYSYVGEKQTLERFSSALEKSRELGMKLGFTKGVVIGSIGLIYATWAFQIWIGSILVMERGEKGGQVFCAQICIIWGGLSLMSALPNLTFILEATTAASRIYQMIDRVPTINSDNKKGKILERVRGEIMFKGVGFTYPSRPNTPILEGFNLSVKAGKTVGLVGGSGSGKSTVISLLERFYDPIVGKIFLDGCDIKRLQLKWLRSQMGLVNQEPILFATSIKENILFGKEGASMDDVVRAAKAANAHDFITKLPDGYDSQVGQFGAQMSGGQKQRIAIARALIRDPKILLLDEATSALDAQSETVVQEALDQASQGRTTIIIAHRLSTIRKADLIVVLQSGKVLESGNHQDLIQLNNGEGGAYSRMLQLQAEDAVQMQGMKTNELHSTEIVRSARSSWQSSPVQLFSPVQPFSPIYSISIIESTQFSSFDDYNIKDSKKSSQPSFSQLRLLRMNAPEWKQAILGCLGAIGSGMCQPYYSYCLGIVASVYFTQDKSHIKSEIRLYSSIFCGLAVINLISGLLQHYNFAIMGERLLKRVRENLLEKVLTFEVGWFDQDENTSAAICARLASEANLVRSLVAERMSLLVQVFCNASLAFILSLIVTWRIAIVMIAMQPLIIACLYTKIVLMKNMSGKARMAQRDGSQLAMEVAINHRTITAFSSQNRMVNLFKIAMKGPKKESIKQSWITGSILSTSQLLTTGSIAFTFWYGGRLQNQGLVDSKQLLQVFLILMGTGRQIAETGSMTSDIAKSGRAITSVFAILDRKTKIEPEVPQAKKLNKVKGNIKLQDVFFAYPARPDQMILKGLNLEIEAGERIALVGQSGSGKSTIIGLIERFYDPAKGSVFIDNCDIKEFNLRKLRSLIALVSQEPALFAGTIRDNIIYGKKDVSENEVRRAARLANAHQFISSMKDGYDTYCGERGVQLSGGQKQRIAIARATLKEPTILLLDEATSALDTVSENLVQEALDKMMIGRTCVVIAHRLSTIQTADSIAVIKNGRVVEIGSHSELLAIGPNGAYYSMISLQNGHST